MTFLGVHGKVSVGEEEQLQGWPVTEQFLNAQLSSCPASRNLLQVKAEPVKNFCVMYVKTGFKKETKPATGKRTR